MQATRTKTRGMFGQLLKIEQNINIIEKNIYRVSQAMDKENEEEDHETIYTRLAYEIAGDILGGKKLKCILRSLKAKEVDWHHQAFTMVAHKLHEQDEFILNPFEVSEGVLECGCGSKRVFSYQRQQRGSDEPMTTFAQCMKCSKQWTYSG